MKTSKIKPVTKKNILIEKPQKIKEVKRQKQSIGGKIMENSEEKDNPEISDKKLIKNPIFLTAMVTILSIGVSIFTTKLTLTSNLDIKKLDYTQEQISSIINTKDFVEAKKLVTFLVEADLIGNKQNQTKILNSLNKNAINEYESINHYLNGALYLDKAWKNDKLFKVDKTLITQDSVLADYKRAINELLWSIEFNPMNWEANAFLGSTYNNIAVLLNTKSFNNKANEYFKKSIEIDCTHTWVLLNMANNLKNMQSYVEMCNVISKIPESDTLKMSKIQLVDYKEYKNLCKKIYSIIKK
jgi:tetratricopeptide (TPR) repeat protein